MVIALPGEWESSTFEESFTRITKRANSIPSADYQEFGKIPVVDQGKELFAGYVDDESLQYSCPPEGLIIFGDHTRIVKFIDQDFVLGADGTQLLAPKDGFYPKYIYHLLKSKEIPNTGYNRHFKFLKEMNFAKPKLHEQKAIAKALSDVDDLIEGFKLEIEKNINIKNGLIQLKLNPLVSNGKLKDHATLASGGTPLTSESAYYGGEIPWVSITDMTNSGKYLDRTAKKLSESGLMNSSAIIYPKNTLLFAMYASIGKCAMPTVPVASSQAILGITVKPSLNLDYLYYILTSRTQDFISMGQQGTQSNLNKIIVGEFDIPVLPINEQEKIASEFANLDLKIETLKFELSKYECIKQGMAHDLLTGKVRLV